MIKLVVVVTPPLRGGGAPHCTSPHVINAQPALSIKSTSRFHWMLSSVSKILDNLIQVLRMPRRGGACNALLIAARITSLQHSLPQCGETLHIRHSTLNRRHSSALDFPLHILIILLFTKPNKSISLRALHHLLRRAAVISCYVLI